MIALLFWMAAAQEPPAEVARWVERLSSENIDQREEAVRRLAALGTPARKALAPLRTGTDLDLARLARRTIGHLDWDGYLPPHARLRPVSDWEALGSENLRDFSAVLGKIVQESGYALGLSRRFQDETDGERRKVLLPYGDGSRFDAATLGQIRDWIETLDPDAFGNELESFARRLYMIGLDAPQIEPAFWKKLLQSPARSRRFVAAWVLGMRKDPDAVPVMTGFVSERKIGDLALDVLRLNPGPASHTAILNEAIREDGHPNAPWVLRGIVQKEDLDRVREAMPKMDPYRLSAMYQILLEAGDRSFLPSLLEKLAGGNGYLFNDKELINVALLFDTEEAVDAVLRRMDKDKTVGRPGESEAFTFGPTGQRMLWERFARDFEEGKFDRSSRIYFRRFLPASVRVEKARLLMAKPVPDPVLEFAVGELNVWSTRHEPSEDDLKRLRVIARERRDTIGNTAAKILFMRKDPELREMLIARLDEPKVEETLWALEQYGDPSLRPHFARLAAKTFPEATRIRALDALTQLPAAESVEILVDALQDDSSHLRETVMKNLEGWPPALLRDRGEVLQKAFEKTPGDYYRTRLLEQLRRIDLPRAAALARSIVSKPDLDVTLRCTALDVLRELGSEKDAPLATALLTAPDVDHASKRRAAEVLLPFDPKAALESLKGSASRGREEDRIPVFASLGRSGRPEVLPFLIDAAWTEDRMPSQAAVEAIARLGGKAAKDFVGDCAAQSDRGRVVPEAWPIAAVRLRTDEVLPSIRRALQPDPAPWTLWALDVILHRAAYDALPATVEQMLKPGTFKEACEAIARACGLEAEVSAALLDWVEKRLAERAPRENDETSVGLSLALLSGGRPEDVLQRWAPEVVTSSRYPGGSSVRLGEGIPWAHVLDGKRLHFVTPDEARAMLGR